MRILSLFDGISGCQVALKNLGAKVSEYHASEINSHAIKVTQKNFFSTFQWGDVNNFDSVWMANARDKFDLMVFGSPCTDLSVARKNRQSLAGKSSGLFYKANQILKEIRPKYFLMENVATMKQESKDKISSLLGVQPVELNSNLFIPQNRRRLYWCNWQLDSLPTNLIQPFKNLLLPVSQVSDLGLSEKGMGYMNRQVADGRNHWDFGHHSDTNRVFSSCVVSNFKKGVPYNVLLDHRVDSDFARSFHAVECERLQGFTDGYTAGIPNTYRYEALGNSFTIPVLEYLLKPIVKKT